MKAKLPLFVLAALLFAGLPLASSSARVALSVAIAPPAIPIYEQPLCPAPGYIWTPGYWAWDGYGYYWVPGVWVAPPRVGFYWTPGYWGYNNGVYVFNDGYWGPSVGYYGGINYGFGYIGHGYYGGQWSGNTFRYNTAVSRVDTTVIQNTYVNRDVVRNSTGSRASFNGPGGVQARPTAKEKSVGKSQRIAPTSTQRNVAETAKKDPALHFKNNKGNPKPDAVRSVQNKVRPDRAAAAAGKGRREAGRAVSENAPDAAQKVRAGRRAANEQADRADNNVRRQKAEGENALDRTRGDKRVDRTVGETNRKADRREGKARDRVSSLNDSARRPAKAERKAQSVAPRARQQAQPRRHVEARKPAARQLQRPQRAQQRAQAVEGHAGGKPAHGREKGRKKKRSKDRPNG